MSKKSKIALALLVTGISAIVFGCGSGSGNSSSPATVQYQNGYYNVTLDFTNSSHQEVGRQYALAIQKAMFDYESNLDASLNTTMQYLSLAGITLQTLIDRAHAIYPNLDPEYQAEISGMQEVFNYTHNELGDGRISKDEFLVYLLGADVMRAGSCSASAVFDSGSASGHTVIGRNADGITYGKTTFGKMHAITTFKNGDKSISTIGTLGFLGGMSVFNRNKMFGAILDASTEVEYPSNVSNRRSYVFDLRHAFETYTKIEDVGQYMGCASDRATCPTYAYNHNIFLADQNKAGILENQSIPKPGFNGNRSIRWANSNLSATYDVEKWKFGTNSIDWAVATVNDYRLVGNYFTGVSINPYQESNDNTNRWRSYRACFLKSKGVTDPASDLDRCTLDISNKRIGLGEMKQIMGYSGPTASGKQVDGALFISEPFTSNFKEANYITLQSIVMDMSTMELWVYLTTPAATPLPKNPTYINVQNPLY